MNGGDGIFFDDDIDLFGDDDGQDEAANQVSGEALRASVEYFKEMFKNGGILTEDEIHSPAAAIILYQHLQKMGYDVSIELEDKHNIVSVFDEGGDDVLTHVQQIMEDLTSLYKSSWASRHKGSTIHTVSCRHVAPAGLKVSIEFTPV